MKSPSKPIIDGGLLHLSSNDTPMRFTNNGTYLGPEREFYRYSSWIRFLGSLYYLIVISCITLSLTISLGIVNTLGKLWVRIHYIQKSDEHSRSSALTSPKLDYTLGLIYEAAAAFMSLIVYPVIRLRCCPRYPLTTDMTWSAGPSISENDRVTITEELITMTRESEVNWWNRLRSLVRKPPIFVLSRGILMSNHLSNADGVIGRGMAFPSGAKILYKGSLGRVPFFGWNFRLAGDILIPFIKNSWKTEDGFKECLWDQLDRITNHRIPVVVFPEGTRSRYRRLAPFRRGMFEFAFERGVPVWPIAIYGTQYAMPCGDLFLNPTDVKIVYSTQLIFPHGHSFSSFTKAVRQEIMSMLRTHVDEFDEEADEPIDDLDYFKFLEATIREKGHALVDSTSNPTSLSTTSSPGLTVNYSSPTTPNSSDMSDAKIERQTSKE